LRSCYGGIAYYYGEITPLDFRDVSLSKDTDPKRQIDLNSAANEVPFLVTASELRDRKVKRRRGSKAEKRPTFFHSFQRHFPPE
jgi:hypothetical protein